MNVERKFFYRLCGYLFTALLVLFLFIFQGKRIEEKPYYEREISFPVMGTIAHLKIQGERGMAPEELHKVLSAMQQEIRDLENECNMYNPQSPVSRLNKSAHSAPFAPSERLWFLLERSRQFYDFSDGSFDITIPPLMKVWGFHKKRDSLPGKKEIKEAKKFVGLAKISFDDDKRVVSFPAPGFQLDLGGIAKGFALDLARKKAEDMGVFRGVLDLGGNILTLSRPYYGKTCYKIGIRDPRKKGEILTVIEMPPGMSIATSGSYERFRQIRGKKVSHIIDPLSGYPAARSLSATILTEKGIDSDALSTILFIKGETFMEKIVKKFPRTRILYFREDEEGKMKGFASGKAFRNAVK